MLVCELIADFFVTKNIKDIFGYPGGMVTYLMDAVSHTQKLRQHLAYHEQGAAFCACGYAQSVGKPGVAYATSGPGATNLVTGIANAYMDSIPCIFITGQVNTSESKGNLCLRQKGFQETEIIPIVSSITKYAKYIDNAEDILYELEKAYAIATSLRQGPVLLDIPMNIQRAEVVPQNLKRFYDKSLDTCFDYLSISHNIIESIKIAKKPLIIAGVGIRSNSLQELFKQFIERIKIPVVTSMIGIDSLPRTNKCNFGMIGAYGCRTANFLIAKSDLIISLGSRLDGRQTGSDKKLFAAKAKIIRIDIDNSEFENKIKDDEVQYLCDLKKLMPELVKVSKKYSFNFNSWLNEAELLRNNLSKFDQQPMNLVIRELSQYIPDNTIITTDVGQNQVWVAQSFQNKKNQKVLFSGGFGSMGYSLPASIGACIATNKPVYCFCGDGGFQMNIQELQMIARDRLPIKIILINNKSLGMIRHFQEMYFESNFAQTKEPGYTVPDFKAIINAYGIACYDYDSCKDKLSELLTNNSPLCIYIEYNQNTYITPKLSVNKPIYDQEPQLSRSFIASLIGDEINE